MMTFKECSAVRKAEKDRMGRDSENKNKTHTHTHTHTQSSNKIRAKRKEERHLWGVGTGVRRVNTSWRQTAPLPQTAWRALCHPSPGELPALLTMTESRKGFLCQDG
jgi:hypothetical protein